MNIGLDYDNTYTRDPKLWDAFIRESRLRGHKVYIVTMRYDNDVEDFEVKTALDGKTDGLFFTCRMGKRTFMYDCGIRIDVWIDDQPDFIIMDAKG